MILKIAYKNIITKPLNTILSVLLLTASVGIISLLIVLQDKAEDHFNTSIKDIDLVMGAKGSPLQLILSAVYQMDDPTGNIDYKLAQKWMNHPFIEKGIPLAYGDNFRGYKIVGSTTDYLSLYKAKYLEGEVFNNDFEVVIGNEVAKEGLLEIGSKFNGVHGASEKGEVHEGKPYKVVGVLESSGTVLDQLIVCSVPSVWKTHDPHGDEEEGAHNHHGHDHHDHHGHGHEEEAEEPKEITAVLLQVKNKMAFMSLPRTVAQNTKMQIASPGIETNRLFSMLGFGVATLTGIAYGIMLISALSIFITLYNNVKDKKYEFALLRTLGASRVQLLLLIYLESLWTAIIGFILGIGLSRLGLRNLIESEESVSFLTQGALALIWEKEGLLLLVTLLIAIIAATIPAVKAYRLSISNTLAHA